LNFCKGGHSRWDAPFWIKVWAVLKARSISKGNDKALKEVVEEIEARKEFPGGSVLRALPTHVECPKCLSWDVDAIETTVRLTKAGVCSVQVAAQYDCRHCSHEWITQG
jgi:hypothetical protein